MLAPFHEMTWRFAALLPVSLSAVVLLGAAKPNRPAPPEARPPQHPGKPVVRLYAIASGDNGQCVESDLAVLAEKFNMVYGAFSREQMDVMRRRNPDFKVLQYVGTFSTNTTSKLLPTQEAEKRRGELLHYLAAYLAGDISAETTGIRLRPIVENIPVSLRPSTAEGEFSAVNAKDTSAKDAPARRAVTWIRIDGEYMRVNGFDPKNGEATVQRAFAGSAAAAHKAGSPVLHPVYLAGDCPGVDTNEYGRPARNIAYIPDPAVPLRWDLTYQEALAALDKGYDGIWIDCLGSKPFNPVDVNGKDLGKMSAAKRSDEELLDGKATSRKLSRLWNFAANEPYTEDAFRLFCERGGAQLQDRLRKRLGKIPVLYANNIGPGYFPDKGGRKFFLMPTETKPRPFDGFCLECFAGTISNTAFSQWYYQNGRPEPPVCHDPEHWEYAVKVCMDAAQDRLAICPMMDQAGWKTQMHEAAPLEARNRFETFAYGSYLITIEKGSPSMLGLPAFYVGDKGRFAWLPDRYFWPIGEPAESHSPGDLEKYRLPGHKTFARRFTNGLVLVNPTKEPDADIRLDRAYFDPETGQSAASVTVEGQTGRILLWRP